ncbi:uncharacterized protein LOC122503636 [Leptopilina heterotoma]|uniref:uncharacterized protein LOC122503636 n=1 Tax=Leptopilina heterotoma TaxID=63436 RepID=UPI001CA88169|nr:uncharacterized protein LOC122503636 [Leptopilina heterotoma]
MSGGSACSARGTGAECRKFAPNIFNKSKCSSCFKQKEEHSAEALECNRVFLQLKKMDLEKINSVGRFEGYLPTKVLAELMKDGLYYVTKMKKVQTKYGPRIIVEIDADFVTYLPTRFIKLFEDEPTTLDMMKEAAVSKKLQMKYLGGPYNVVEFKVLQ